jgi:hypothetical protein
MQSDDESNIPLNMVEIDFESYDYILSYFPGGKGE